MAVKVCEDAEFMDLVRTLGTAATSRRLGIAERAVRGRRKRIEDRLKVEIRSPISYAGLTKVNYPERHQLELKNGLIIVGSDAHIWPGDRSTAIRAFIKICHELKPKIVVLNGDVLDFGRISRHQAIGWETTPKVHEEIEAAQDILHDIEQACARGTQKIWPLGNHDSRFETKIANNDPEYAMIKGVHLSDHFPNWVKCWSLFINNDIVIKHRFKGGIHATHNNALWSGKTIITGHLHSHKITPLTDYNGTRYGVDTGCLADVSAKAFVNYTEDNPKNWLAGFCVLTVMDGIMLPPELVTVWDENTVVFRGELIRV
jgi:hypothetical protein